MVAHAKILRHDIARFRIIAFYLIIPGKLPDLLVTIAIHRFISLIMGGLANIREYQLRHSVRIDVRDYESEFVLLVFALIWVI